MPSLSTILAGCKPVVALLLCGLLVLPAACTTTRPGADPTASEIERPEPLDPRIKPLTVEQEEGVAGL
ncbi:hypothetical protein OSJ77_00300 [Phyllobacterium sp. 0TCS1.6C]|uniref:hypothetical protein n=1 Tax=unclassified Phyllobacterium TaxID=2638441 RepID=UPI002265438E|nr:MULTISPECIES: hypothetical protein [unclassified Phyllobacterium]MCX8278628.1 hypothetical protein [Phyllobacterium sp. 0TCS1.6C]MCX8293542.1 hypothetical protein [Phyllobacterium sp. 0TCS1.6A]